jgi:hypothetical protein
MAGVISLVRVRLSPESANKKILSLYFRNKEQICLYLFKYLRDNGIGKGKKTSGPAFSYG